MLAFIGGTGLTRMANLEIIGERDADTSWGTASAPVTEGRLAGERVMFLPRHGNPHRLPPHRVNYRANIAALAAAGATEIIAVNAVGGISGRALENGMLVLPDQLIDYTWGRDSTFFEDEKNEPTHVDFTRPFDSSLRQRLAGALGEAGVEWIDSGCYGATQGPRLETAAEILRMERDGCTLVGMTGMPEAVLAREAGMAYAMLCLVVNPAAGKSEGEISMGEIAAVVEQGMERVQAVLTRMAG